MSLCRTPVSVQKGNTSLVVDGTYSHCVCTVLWVWSKWQVRKKWDKMCLTESWEILAVTGILFLRRRVLPLKDKHGH